MKTILLSLLVAFSPLLALCQLLSNYDTCRTQMYYQYIGNAAKETHFEKARTIQDNGIISAGYLKQAGSQNAIIIKQNTLGEVIWQKEYGNTDYDERFTDWRELTNKQLLVGGIAKNRVTLQSVFFMLLLAPDGNIIWQKSYADLAASSNISNAKVYPDYWGEYFFAVETDSVIIYGMTNNTGALNWQRAINTNPGTKLVAGVSYYSRLLIVTNALDSGYHVANFYYVDYYWTNNPKTIKYSTKLGGLHQNSHYILHDYEHYSQYTYFSGIRSVNNAPYEVVRVNINQGYIREALETINTPGVVIDSLSRSAINIYGDVVSFISGRKNNRLHAISLTGSYNNPTDIIWRASYQLPDSIVIKGNIKTWDNGYVFAGFKELPSGNKQIIQLKTDSAAISTYCINRQVGNFSLTRNPFPTDTVRYTYNSLHTLAGFNYTASVSNSTFDTLNTCREITCPQLPLSDSCSPGYQKLYKAYEPVSYLPNVLVVNGRTFMSGIVQPMDYVPTGNNAFIAEMNGNGQVISQRKYLVGLGCNPRMYKGLDSSLLLYGFTADSAYYPSIFLAKIDTNLNVAWMKSLRLTTTVQYGSNQQVGEVKQGSDGSYFLLYSDGITFGQTTVFLTKLDVNGNFVWSKVYRISYSIASNLIAGYKLVVFGGHVYIMCRNAYNNYAASILLKVTENNGNLLWCKKYSNTEDYLDLSNLLSVQNNELLMGGNFIDNSSLYRQNILLKANTDGAILGGITLKNTPTNTAPLLNFMHHSGSGNTYMSGVFYSTPPVSNPYQINVTVDNNLSIITSKKRPTTPITIGHSLAIGPGGQLYETGSYSTNSNNYSSLIYLIKFNPDGSTGTCPSDTMLLQRLAAPPISVTNVNCVQSDSIFNIRTPIYQANQFFLATSNLLCASVPGCNTLDITGIDSICDKSLLYTYRAIRNNGCSAPLQWLYDNSNAQIINQTDSLITIRFLTPGNFLLKARFTSNCTPYTDSLLIHVMGDAPVLNLGPDTTLCPGASLVLGAKKGFFSYLWQDGSTDSTFTVIATANEVYHVTVSDSCRNSFTDSIRVQVNGNGPLLNLGADSNFCNTNAILLNARTGFLSYLWQNGSTDSTFTATVPGVYYVKVTDACGNHLSDTVKISAYRRASSLNLGADTVFCGAVSMLLNAKRGFQYYVWQDGSTDSTFLVQQTGLYYVRVTDSCGNIFTDSIRILPDNFIVFNIGSDTTICQSDSVLLQAPAGLASYTWWPQANTLPQSQTAITVFPNSSTWYHVLAIKPNGCTVTDSVFIQVFTPSTINLGPDRRICAGDTLLLNAGTGFMSYIWSTGAQTATIGAYQVGQYHVTATDNNNCKARDSFSIVQLIPLPVIPLPTETFVCNGQPKTLHAGTGFASYLWNTGGLTESIAVTSMGQYWVAVTNAAGCKQTDTVNINRILALPSNFIKDKDSTICNFETLVIAPSQDYMSYLWNTGATTRSITVSTAGNYWLKVTDINGCIGSDSFTLATKDCNIGLFFPNSFTPNNDGLNDTYKPRAYGRLSQYHISIFNRYGERVFDSRSIGEGWNGEFKAVRQEAGAYVWQCSYQLDGEAVQNLSGTFLLIR